MINTMDSEILTYLDSFDDDDFHSINEFSKREVRHRSI
jgi:hypothetical protein